MGKINSTNTLSCSAHSLNFSSLDVSDEYELKLIVATSDGNECNISASNVTELDTFQAENLSANGDFLIIVLSSITSGIMMVLCGGSVVFFLIWLFLEIYDSKKVSVFYLQCVLNMYILTSYILTKLCLIAMHYL